MNNKDAPYVLSAEVAPPPSSSRQAPRNPPAPAGGALAAARDARDAGCGGGAGQVNLNEATQSPRAVVLPQARACRLPPSRHHTPASIGVAACGAA